MGVGTTEVTTAADILGDLMLIRTITENTMLGLIALGLSGDLGATMFQVIR